MKSYVWNFSEVAILCMHMPYGCHTQKLCVYLGTIPNYHGCGSVEGRSPWFLAKDVGPYPTTLEYTHTQIQQGGTTLTIIDQFLSGNGQASERIFPTSNHTMKRSNTLQYLYHVYSVSRKIGCHLACSPIFLWKVASPFHVAAHHHSLAANLQELSPISTFQLKM